MGWRGLPRGPPHVLLPGVAAGFSPAARGLLAAERPTDLGSVRRDIHVDYSAVAPQSTKIIMNKNALPLLF